MIHMPSDVMRVLGKRAAQSRKWRWLPGMLAIEWAAPGMSLTGGRPVRVDDGWPEVGVWLPDLSDPATLGCLLHLVREAWGQDDMGASRHKERWCVEFTPQEAQNYAFYGASEAEALVAALEAAPRSTKKEGT